MSLTWATAGPVLSGLGSLASGFGVGGGSSRAKPSSWDIAQIRHGIKIRVGDAQEAGIHPLFALGANTVSPVGSYGSGSKDGAAVGRALSGLGTAVSDIGTVRNAALAQAMQSERHTAQLGLIEDQRKLAQARIREIDDSISARGGQAANAQPTTAGGLAGYETIMPAAIGNPKTGVVKGDPRWKIVKSPFGPWWIDSSVAPQQFWEETRGSGTGELMGGAQTAKEFGRNVRRYWDWRKRAWRYKSRRSQWDNPYGG